MPRGSTRSAALYDLRNRQPPPAIQGTRARFARDIGTTWIADAHARPGRRERSPFILAFVVAVWHAPGSRWKGIRHESSLAGHRSHRTRSAGCQLRPRLSAEDGAGRRLHIERD